MKSDVKKNLWEILKYLLTLGINGIIKLVQRKRAKKLKEQQSISDMDLEP